MELLKRLTLVCLTALWLIHGAVIAEEAANQKPQQERQPQLEADQESQAEALFPPDQIEQLVAPIALYPDALLAQMLMASTYPLDIVQAARWLGANEGLEGEALETAAEEHPWDPSVKTLVFFPQVLEYMNDNLDWTQDLGDAMLAQQDEVMDAVQRLRNEAQDAGTLETNEQQRVETEGDTIIVQPADPEVVYVPTYDPSQVYGQTAPPSTTYYPATYTTPKTTTNVTGTSSSSDNWISFGAGAVVGGLLTAAILWDRNSYGVYPGGRGRYGRPGYWGRPNYWKGGWKRPVNINRGVDVSRGDVNINRQVKKWEHNPQRRGGVRYRGNSTKQKFASVRKDRNIDRDLARGRDPDRKRPGSGGGQRPGAGERPGLGGGQRPSTKPAQRPGTREAARPAKPAQRPAGKPAKRPAAKPAKRPAAKPAQRSAAKPAKKPARRDVKRSSGGKSSAFNVKKGKTDRAASRRGASSRSGTGGRRGGGGRGGGRRG